MTAPNDRQEEGGPQDDAYQPRPLLGRFFWVMLALAAVCVAAGIAVAVLGPGLPLDRS